MNNVEKDSVQEVPVTPIMPPVAKTTMYDTHIKENFHIFGIASILYACLYTFCMYKNDSGITYPIMILGSIAFVCFCQEKLEIAWKKESIFYGVSLMLLAVSTCCTDDYRIIFLNKVGIFLLMVCMILGIVYDTRKWELKKFFASIIKVIFMAIGEVARPFSDAVWFCKNKLDKKNSKYIYIMIGVGVAIPVVVVIFVLLSSADAVFRDFGDRLFSRLNTGDIFGIAWMFAIAFLASYCLLAYVSKKTVKEEVDDTRKWEPLIAIPVTSVLSVMYLVFSGIQIMYLFMGNMQLPKGYTYAEYAREGFFQLLAVSVINLVIVLIGLSRFKKSRILKAVLTVLSLCTFIMIASSALRMVIYIQYYYLTFLRIFVLWSLVVLFLLFVGVIIYIIKEDFPLFRYAMVVVTCLYIVFSFCHPDYWIAKVNLAGTKEVRCQFFKGETYSDYGFLADLNADAAPVLLAWTAEEGYSFESYFSKGLTYAEYVDLMYDAEDKTIAEKKDWCSYLYLRHLQERCEDMSFRELNFSRWNADVKVRAYTIQQER
ncbi:MAG: DUF4173 domain-containing protein [Agathobacter sp.]|nr:DUF4173 domain-containing protein [Agathobacter sp.]